MFTITAIKLPATLKGYKNNAEKSREFLEPVSRINIFVGANNSGKSRFMRELAKQDEYFVKIQEVDVDELSLKIANYVKSIKDKLAQLNFSSINDLTISDLDTIKRESTNYLNLSSVNYESVRTILEQLANHPGAQSGFTKSNVGVNIDDTNKSDFSVLINDGAAELLKLVEQIPDFSKTDFPKKVYIPVLRGLRPFDENSTDFYKDYNEPQKLDR